MPLLPSERVPYSAMPDRPRLHLPGSARIAVWIIANAEYWDSSHAMPRTLLPPPMGLPLIPDIPNWTWHEYGMRVGIWRIAELLNSLGIRATFAVNGMVCERYPRIAETALKREWEFIGHGFVQEPLHQAEDQASAIGRTIDAIRRFTGRAPRGWESPGLAETLDTVDLLANAGIEYVADWVLDDQPCQINATGGGSIISVPYTVEVNDVSVMAVQRLSSEEFLNRGIRQFDRLYDEGRQNARFMAISVHPYLSGVPHRIGHLEELIRHITAHPDVLMWTGEQILDWYKAAQPESPVSRLSRVSSP